MKTTLTFHGGRMSAGWSLLMMVQEEEELSCICAKFTHLKVNWASPSVAANQQNEISGATNYAPFNQLVLSSSL